MKKRLAFMFGVILCISLMFMGKTVDAKQTAVDWLVSQKLLVKSTFPDCGEIQKNPDRLITREEYITLLMKAAGQAESQKAFQKMEYKDKESISTEYRGYLGRADQLEILVYDGERVKAGKVLTKEAAAYFLGKLTGAAYYTPLTFKDCKKVSDAGIYIKGLEAVNVISAKSDDQYGTYKELSWNEAAKYIQKAEKQGLFKARTISKYGGDFMEVEEKNRLLRPYGMTAASDGSIYVADKGSNTIKRYENGAMRIVAGKYTGKDAYGEEIGGYRDDWAANAIFNHPEDLCITENGTIYVSDTQNHVIRQVKDGKVTTFAGNGQPGYMDGNGLSASFSEPKGITCDDKGNIYVADSGNHCIRKISPEREVTTFAGSEREGCRDGEGQKAAFSYPTDVLFVNGTWYVVDSGNQRICVIKDENLAAVSTLAGGSRGVYDQDGRIMSEFHDGKGKKAGFSSPYSIAADDKGNLYVTEASNGMVRKIDAEGNVTTIAGFSSPAWKQKPMALAQPSGILYTNGKLLITDAFQNTMFLCKQ